MIQRDDSSLCYDVTITYQNFKNIWYFRAISIITSRTDVFRDVISLIINQCDPRRPQSVR